MDPSEEDRIVEKHAGLVRHIVARTLRIYTRLPGGIDRDDLEMHGKIGLVYAARTYDAAKGFAFSTYAYKCIQNQIIGALDRAKTNEIECTSLQILISDDGDTTLEDQCPDLGEDAEETVLRNDTRRSLLEAIRQLDLPYSAIVEKFYFNEMSLVEVAQELRMSQHRVQLLHSKALKMLRRRLHATL